MAGSGMVRLLFITQNVWCGSILGHVRILWCRTAAEFAPKSATPYASWPQVKLEWPAFAVPKRTSALEFGEIWASKRRE
jgi:hypothetical protein